MKTIQHWLLTNGIAAWVKLGTSVSAKEIHDLLAASQAAGVSLAELIELTRADLVTAELSPPLEPRPGLHKRRPGTGAAIAAGLAKRAAQREKGGLCLYCDKKRVSGKKLCRAHITRLAGVRAKRAA